MTFSDAHLGDGARKTAALLIAMGRPLAQRMVSRLDADELRLISATARRMPEMNRAVLEALVEDFARHFVEKVSAGPIESEIGAIITGGIGEDAAGRLHEKANLDATEEAYWPKLAAFSPERLADVLKGEQASIIASVFSAFEPKVVTSVLAVLEPEARAAVTAQMLAAAPPTAPVLRELELHLWSALNVEDPSVRSSANRKKVAAALNGLGRDAAYAIIDDLRKNEPADADALQAMLFDFDDVLKLSAAARSILFDGQPTDRVIAALHGSDAELSAAVLGALGARARRMAEAELANGTPPAAAAVTAARRAIADAALQLADAGRISLQGENDV